MILFDSRDSGEWENGKLPKASQGRQVPLNPSSQIVSPVTYGSSHNLFLLFLHIANTKLGNRTLAAQTS